MPLEHPDKLMADVNEAAAALTGLAGGDKLAQAVIQLRDLFLITTATLEATASLVERQAMAGASS